MELLDSFAQLLLGIIKRLYWLVPSLFTDPFDFIERWFKVSYSPPQWLFWLLLSMGFVIADTLTYHELRMRSNDIDITIRKLQAIGNKSINATNTLCELSEKLAIGISEYDNLGTIRPMLVKLSLLQVVQLEQRQRASGPRTVDIGYWVLTDLGKKVIRHLKEKHR